jgi:hypothetical protein
MSDYMDYDTPGELIETPQADWRKDGFATGRMRFLVPPVTSSAVPVLQQEWAVHWGNNMGEQVTKEWFTIPLVIESTLAKEADQ